MLIMNTREIFSSPEAEILRSFFNSVHLTQQDTAEIIYLDYLDSGLDDDGNVLMGLQVKKESKELSPLEMENNTPNFIIYQIIKERLKKFNAILEDNVYDVAPESIQDAAQKINLASNLLASKTRRGPANTLVCNAFNGTIITEMLNFSYVNYNQTLAQSGLPYHIGNLNGSIKVIVDPYMRYDDTRILIMRIGREDEPGYSVVIREQYIKSKEIVETVLKSTKDEYSKIDTQTVTKKLIHEFDTAFLETNRAVDTMAIINVDFEKLQKLI